MKRGYCCESRSSDGSGDRLESVRFSTQRSALEIAKVLQNTPLARFAKWSAFRIGETTPWGNGGLSRTRIATMPVITIAETIE